MTSSAMHEALKTPHLWRAGMLLKPCALGHPQYQILRVGIAGAATPESALSKTILAMEVFP